MAIPDYTKQFPTQGDLARAQVRRRGLPYWQDVQVAIRERLARIAPDRRRAFAAACAERLLREHERAPVGEQDEFALSWRGVLDVVWEGLAENGKNAVAVVERRLRELQSEELPEGADHDAAASSIYAAECYLGGGVEQACWASGREIDSACAIAADELGLAPNDFVWDPTAEPAMPLAQEAMHPAVQGVRARQLADLERLEREGLTTALLQQLRC